MKISPVNFVNYKNTSFKSKFSDQIEVKPVNILPASAKEINLYDLSINNNELKIGSKHQDAFCLTEDGKCYIYKNGKKTPANVAVKITFPDKEQTDMYINGEKVMTVQKTSGKVF